MVYMVSSVLQHSRVAYGIHASSYNCSHCCACLLLFPLSLGYSFEDRLVLFHHRFLKLGLARAALGVSFSLFKLSPKPQTLNCQSLVRVRHNQARKRPEFRIRCATTRESPDATELSLLLLLFVLFFIPVLPLIIASITIITYVPNFEGLIKG